MAHYASFYFFTLAFHNNHIGCTYSPFWAKTEHAPIASRKHTHTHTHTCVMHNALCCSRFSVVIPPLHTQSVPGYQTWQCQLGSWQQPSREEEKETESKREREMETQQDNVKKGCRGGGCGRHGLQHSSVCSVPHWSKTCCRTVPVGFFWEGKLLWVEQCSVYIKTAVSTGVCATSKHSTHRWLTLSN